MFADILDNFFVAGIGGAHIMKSKTKKLPVPLYKFTTESGFSYLATLGTKTLEETRESYIGLSYRMMDNSLEKLVSIEES